MDKKIIINISASADSFGAFAENPEIGIFGAGDTVDACKNDILTAISLYKEFNPQEEWPDAIKENWPIEWHYDTQSLLKHYEGIFTKAALERMTGINQKQLWNYANGISRPRKEAKLKIQDALHSLGRDLLALTL